MKVTRKSSLRQIISATERQAAKAVTAGVEEAEIVMNQLVPVDDGNLQSTIEKNDDGNGKASIKAGGQSKKNPEVFVDYEMHVEFGTVKMAAQPFFRPGVDAGRRKMKSEMKIVDK